MNDTERAILAALTDLSGIGDARAYSLYSHFEDPLQVSNPPKSLVNEFHYVDSDIYEKLQALDDEIKTYCRQFEQYANNGITVLGIDDDLYPDPVRNGPAPVLLYAKGNVNRLADDTVGVSGSRETNETGREWIQSLSTYLVQDGYTIVSGGAQGADTAAHKGAIESNAATIAVLGTGVNVAYPPENESLFTRIVEKDGLLVSMFPPEAEPTRHSFLERNELLAALSKSMIFVATDCSGGTMAQYEIATEQGKPIFVPPSDLGIEPAEGISTLRESTSTSVIRTASNLSEALADPGVDQTNLDNWT